MIAWIAAGLVLRHDLKAFWAASVAWRASFLEAAEDVQRGLLSAGFWTSKVVLVVTSLPSIHSGTGPEDVPFVWDAMVILLDFSSGLVGFAFYVLETR